MQVEQKLEKENEESENTRLISVFKVLNVLHVSSDKVSQTYYCIVIAKLFYNKLYPESITELLIRILKFLRFFFCLSFLYSHFLTMLMKCIPHTFFEKYIFIKETSFIVHRS